MTYRRVHLMDRDIPDTPPPANNHRLQLDMKRALIPISLLVFFVLYFYVRVPIWGLAILMLWIPLYYMGVPIYTRYRWTLFEKEFAYRFPQQDYKGLLAYYRSQWFLRQFGPKAPMLGKLGLIYSAMGRYRDAERILEAAVRFAIPGTGEKFMLNLAHVKYELGKYNEARQLYQRLLKRTPHLSGAANRIAMINAHTGTNLQEALEHLERNLPLATGEEQTRITEAIQSARSQLGSV
ncbi:MAG: tetratricopeptide repeat protein [Myxococcota bacterium]